MFAGVKQGSNPLQVDEAQLHVALAVTRRVEVANDLLGLSLGIAAVGLYPCGCHHWKLGRLAVLGLPVARGEAELPAPGLKVLRWYEEILGREAVLTSEALHTVAAQEIEAGLVEIPGIQAEIGLIAGSKESRKAWGQVLGALARRLGPRV